MYPMSYGGGYAPFAPFDDYLNDPYSYYNEPDLGLYDGGLYGNFNNHYGRYGTGYGGFGMGYPRYGGYGFRSRLAGSFGRRGLRRSMSFW